MVQLSKRTRRSITPALVLVLGAAASCTGMTCDQNKKESIVRMNAGVDAAKARVYDNAEKELEAATSLDQTNHLAAYSLGQVYAERKKWDKAADAFTLAVKNNGDDPMYHYKLGQALFEAKKLDAAKKELDRAIALNKRLFKAHWYEGKILAAQGKYREAANEWTETCKLNPGFGKAFIDLGRLYYQWDFLQEAVMVLQNGGLYARDADDQTNIYYYLGMAFDGLKQYDKAADAYLKAIETQKNNIEARLQAGMAFANKGDKDKAKKYLSEFVKMGGGNNPFNVQAAQD